MPVLNRIAGYADDMTEWRRWMHRNPELGFDCHKTAAFAAAVARDVVGADAVVDNAPPEMFAEDFAYMLEARPGAYVKLGQGDTPMCHDPAYDFADEIAPIGASFFARLVETAQPV